MHFLFILLLSRNQKYGTCAIYFCTDVAIWVLNKQITEEDNLTITYNYKLIDDLDYSSHPNLLYSALQYCCGCLRCCKSLLSNPQSTVNESAHAQSYEIIDMQSSGNREDEQCKYRPINHLLYIMVSKLYIEIYQCYYTDAEEAVKIWGVKIESLKCFI